MTKTSAAKPVTPLEPWVKNVVKNSRGKTESWAANAITILEGVCGGCLRRSVRGGRGEWTSPPPWNASAELTELDGERACQWLARVWRMSWKPLGCLEILERIAEENSYDPVVEYLEGLEWDGEPRARMWLSNSFGVEPSEYAQEVALRWLLQAVNRAFEPGCKADHVLILAGVEGAGKSTGLRIMAGEWFTDTPVNPVDKDSLLAVIPKWVVEWGDLAGMPYREAEALKAFFSRQTDIARRPYGRSNREYPRRFVFAGTTNRQAFLTDPTGNRRYWPVGVRTGPRVDTKIRDWMEQNRDQIWAEAVHWYHEGDRGYLPQEIEIIARGVTEEYRAEEPWTELVTGFMEARTSSEPPTTGDVLRGIGVPSDRQNSGAVRKLGAAMREAGYERHRRRSGNGRVYVWVERRGE